MRNILDWDFEEWLGALIIAFIGGLLLLLAVIVRADKTPTGYYLSGKMASPSNLVCVHAAQQWDSDTEVFCSADPEQAFSVLAKANAEVRKVAR